MDVADEPGLNTHIVVRDGWSLISGNPRIYLNWVLNARNTGRPYAPGKTPWPEGKLPFDNFVRRHGGAAPRTLALIDGGKVARGPGAGSEAVEFVRRLPDGNYFCKRNVGGQGMGALRLDVTDGVLHADGQEQSADAVAEILSGHPYVIQESLTPRQHEQLARFHAHTTNTLRLVTYARDGIPVPVSAFIRFATASVTVDNWSAGGVAVPVDLTEGTMGPLGVKKKGEGFVDRHPVSGILFESEALPDWQKAVALACRLHAELGVHSLGWDIAFLRDGPCIVECNRFWDVYLGVQMTPDFVSEFLAFHLPPGPLPPVRLEIAGTFADKSVVRLWIAQFLGRHLASARIESFTPERIALVAATPRPNLEKMAARLKRPVHKEITISSVRISRCNEPVQPGLDVEAMLPQMA